MRFKWTNRLFRAIPTLGLAAVMAFPVSAMADEDESKKDEGQQTTQAESGDDKDGTSKLKIFELKNRDPQELNRIIELAEQSSQQAATRSGAGRQAVASARSSGRTVRGYRGVREGQLVTAFNAKDKTLFVRGSDEQISKVAELVKTFDVEDKNLKTHEYRGVRLVPVRSADASEVQSTLSQLQLPGQMLRMGEISLVYFHGDDANKEKTEQAEQVIKQLKARVEDDQKEDSGDSDESSDSDSDSDSDDSDDKDAEDDKDDSDKDDSDN